MVLWLTIRTVLLSGFTFFLSSHIKLFTEVPVPNQERERSCICVGGYQFCLCFYDFVVLDFGNVLTVCHFLLFIF